MVRQLALVHTENKTGRLFVLGRGVGVGTEGRHQKYDSKTMVSATVIYNSNTYYII